MEEGAGQHVSYREHVAFKEAMTEEMHELKLRQARLDHMPQALGELGTKLDKVLDAQRAAPIAAPDHASLALHRAVDVIAPLAEKVGNSNGTSLIDTVIKLSAGGSLTYIVLNALGAFR